MTQVIGFGPTMFNGKRRENNFHLWICCVVTKRRASHIPAVSSCYGVRDTMLIFRSGGGGGHALLVEATRGRGRVRSKDFETRFGSCNVIGVLLSLFLNNRIIPL